MLTGKSLLFEIKTVLNELDMPILAAKMINIKYNWLSVWLIIRASMPDSAIKKAKIKTF